MFKRFLPIFILFIGFLTAYSFGLSSYLSLENIITQQGRIKSLISTHFFVSALAYFCIYTFFVTLSLPGALILSLAGGLFFGAFIATPLIVCAATLGATFVFLFARFTKIDVSKLGNAASKFKEGFAKNAFHYLLFIRLTPIFPFFLVNLAPALLGVRLRTFILSTFIGITPATAIYAYIGQSLGAVVENPSQLLSKEIFIALSSLGLLALLPLVFKRKSKDV
jgi:uncharacterized membrane protein YdjX (TVP38/TMEM64 family)